MTWYLWTLLVIHVLGVLVLYIATHIVMVNNSYSYKKRTKVIVFAILLFWELYWIYYYINVILKVRKNKMIERGF